MATLDVGDNQLGPDGGAAVMEALRVCAPVVDAVVTTGCICVCACVCGSLCNTLAQRCFGKRVVAAQGHTALTTLEIGHNHIGPEASSSLAELLKVSL